MLWNILRILKKKLSAKINLQAVDALSLAEKAGTIKAVNVVLIGLLAKEYGRR